MLVVSLWPNEAFLARRFPLNQITLGNYVETFRVLPFGRYFLNSAIVTVTVTVLQILISSLAAFAFARLRFRGRETIFLLYLATLMIPVQVTLIPNFLIIKNLGWYDTYLALIVPALFSALSTFLLRQYYRGIPLDLDEAARMDGASSLRIWWQIIVPLSWPVMAALAIFTFQATWNDFLWPLDRNRLRHDAHDPHRSRVLRRPVQHSVEPADGRVGARAAAGADRVFPGPEDLCPGDHVDGDGGTVSRRSRGARERRSTGAEEHGSGGAGNDRT